MDNQILLLWELFWSALASVAAWTLRPAWQMPAIVVCGGAFLGMVSPVALSLLVVGTAATYWSARRGGIGRGGLLSGVVSIVLVFGWYLVKSRPDLQVSERQLMPFGLAFFALRLIHYLFESFKGTLRPHEPLEYACYQLLPGTLAAGPIHRFDEFQRDLRRRRWDASLFCEGLERILYGLVKIVVLANYLVGGAGARAVSGMEGGIAHTYLSMVAFWVSLYLTFSGYSDVAIGFAATMGLRIRENFSWPFLARNISEFWQRWHYSLSSWCRDYVYNPVLASTRRPALAVVVSMVVLGLWHEASVRYVLWGAYHGIGIAVYRSFDERLGPAVGNLPARAAGCWQVLATVLTLHFVMLSFLVTTRLQALFMGL